MIFVIFEGNNPKGNITYLLSYLDSFRIDTNVGYIRIIFTHVSHSYSKRYGCMGYQWPFYMRLRLYTENTHIHPFLYTSIQMTKYKLLSVTWPAGIWFIAETKTSGLVLHY